MNSKLIFFSNFINKPKEVAAISTSSKYLINKIIKNIDFNKTKCIVEYGPGIGTVTKSILKNLNRDTKLICFESNSEFCMFLHKNLNDSRLIIVNDSAENIGYYFKKLNITNVDYVLSSIPFSFIKKEIKKSIIKKTRYILRKSGKFIIYQQYNWHLKKYLNMYFKKISTEIELRNIPPTMFYVCKKI